MSGDERHGEGTSRQEHGEVLHAGPRREELRLAGKVESSTVKVLLAHGSRDHGGKLPGKGAACGLLECRDRPTGALLVGATGIAGRRIPDDRERDSLGRMAQCFGKKLGTDTGGITSNKANDRK
jgi:hypothetical protein